MEPFTCLVAKAAPLMEDNVDTDAIFPARFLLLMEKAGLGAYLFHDRRQGARPAFPLDRPEFAGARILVSGANFGCGSSREQAAWALAGAGFRCVIASSFGDIFYANALKNGLLPVILPEAAVAELARLAEQGATLRVDLAEQVVQAGERPPYGFAIPAQAKETLLDGRDEIDAILLHERLIAAFEAASRRRQPWLYDRQSAASDFKPRD